MDRDKLLEAVVSAMWQQENVYTPEIFTRIGRNRENWRKKAMSALTVVEPMIRADEREACAAICDAWADAVEAKAPKSPTIIQARNHAAAIRARGKA
jgi:hypothetical protein